MTPDYHGDHQAAPEALRQRLDRGIQDREVILGGVGPGRPGQQHSGQRLAGVVTVGQQRVVTSTSP